jgi:glycosyltransferase involved in cell wall biosynthesis
VPYLVFVGNSSDDQYLNKFNQEIQNTEFGENIRHIDQINPDSPLHASAYASADVFVLPSLVESFGITILEAWASKVPVIASKVGGVPYFVEHEKNGLLFENNNLDQLVRHLQTLLSNADLSKKLAESGYNAVKTRYEWNIIAAQLEAIYESVLQDTTS